MSRPFSAPQPQLSRVRLALITISPALLVVLVAVAATFVVLANLQAGDARTQAGLARVGTDLALVVVTDNGEAAIASARGFVDDWGLLVLVAALIPAIGASWAIAGRVRGTVDRANAEIEAADEVRRTRLQEVVHELRTPLAVMGTNLELAGDQAASQPKAVDYIDAARRAVTRMARTVDDLAGQGGLTVEQGIGLVDLGELARAGTADDSGPGRVRGVHVGPVGSATILVPGVDPAVVRTVLSNLLSNAIRLAPRGSAVTVDWGECGGWAWLAVTDEGPGLAPHLHARAFERGWQGSHDRDRSARNGGTGLGLTIARQLTEAQGGVVTIDSEEGGGATFTLWLPLGHDADESAIVTADRVHPGIRPWLKDAVGA